MNIRENHSDILQFFLGNFQSRNALEQSRENIC